MIQGHIREAGKRLVLAPQGVCMIPECAGGAMEWTEDAFLGAQVLVAVCTGHFQRMAPHENHDTDTAEKGNP